MTLVPSILIFVQILNLRIFFCYNYIQNFRFDGESSPLITDQTGGYERQNLPDENPRVVNGNTEEKRIRLVISNCVFSCFSNRGDINATAASNQ